MPDDDPYRQWAMPFLELANPILLLRAVNDVTKSTYKLHELDLIPPVQLEAILALTALVNPSPDDD